MKRLNELNREILPVAAVLGLLTGLLEGSGLLLFRYKQWLYWRLANRAFWTETLWISPFVDLVLFLLVGLALSLLGIVLSKVLVKRIAWFSLIFLAIFDWFFLALFGRISLLPLLILSVGASVQLMYSAMRIDTKLTKFAKRSFPWLAGISVLLFMVIQGGGWISEKNGTSKLPAFQAGTPNVIVIVVDTLRADHLSAYGYKRDTSPFIESLVKQGVMFSDAISASSWTQPSHASMLTGRYTYEHQAETKPLDNRFATIGEAMQAQGYRTGAFSANTEFFTRRQGFGRGFLHFEDNNQSLLDDFLNSSLYGFLFDYYGLRKTLDYEGVPTRKYAEDINRSVLNWLSKGDNKPFFVFINYFDVHDPYLPPQPYRNKYSSTPNPGGLVNGFVDRYHPDLTPEQLQSEINAYDGSISYVDDQIKAFFNELGQRNMLDNTIVIVTSDHGESLGEHGLLQHSASLYLQEIHVPLIVWGPGVPAGKQIDTPVSTTALPSTILSLIKAHNNPFPGPSLTELVFNDTVPASWPDPISEVAQFVGAAEQNPTTHGEMKSVVGDDMQYIVHEKFGDELYKWRTDPEEINNLAKDPSQMNILDTFKKYLKELVGEPIFKNP
jgi:arylsulfatase A-like enzyme